MRKQQGDEFCLEMLEKYRGLVLKMAWEYWNRLPASAKVWVDPDDLIEEIYLFVLTSAAKTYNKKKASKMTFLWISIKNLLLNFALSQQTQKRFGWNVPLEELITIGKPDRQITEIDALQALNRTYLQASPLLQVEMKKWFGPGKPSSSRGDEAEGLRTEFLLLANKNKLTVDDCRRLMGHGIWI